jgi:hypothetical protein
VIIPWIHSTKYNNVTIEMKQGAVMTNLATYGQKKLLGSRHMERQTKCALHNMLARPVHTSESESWSLSREDENMLRIF